MVTLMGVVPSVICTTGKVVHPAGAVFARRSICTTLIAFFSVNCAAVHVVLSAPGRKLPHAMRGVPANESPPVEIAAALTVPEAVTLAKFAGPGTLIPFTASPTCRILSVDSASAVRSAVFALLRKLMASVFASRRDPAPAGLAVADLKAVAVELLAK